MFFTFGWLHNYYTQIEIGAELEHQLKVDSAIKRIDMGSGNYQPFVSHPKLNKKPAFRRDFS